VGQNGQKIIFYANQSIVRNLGLIAPQTYIFVVWYSFWRFNNVVFRVLSCDQIAPPFRFLYTMVRNYVKKVPADRRVDCDAMQRAVAAVIAGQSCHGASLEFHVPRTSLRRQVVAARAKKPFKRGNKNAVFTPPQEKVLADRITLMCRRGFGVSYKVLRAIVLDYAKEINRHKRNVDNVKIPPSWIRNQKAGRDWAFAFARRNKLTPRVAENLSKARAIAFNKDRVANYFAEFRTLINKLGIEHAPHRYYNADETGLSTVPPAPKILSPVGQRSVISVGAGERGTLTTILPCGNAFGNIIPPFIVRKGIRLNPELRNGFPEGAVVVNTKSGYIDQDQFGEFLVHLHGHRSTPEPIVLVCDGHQSHNTLANLQYAVDHDIHIICLPPHCTHELQMMDTHVNRALKAKWSEIVSEKQVCTATFSARFSELWASFDSKWSTLLINGFRHTGVFPFNDQVVKEEKFQPSLTFTDGNVLLEDAQPATPSTRLAINEVLPCHQEPAKLLPDHKAHLTSPTHVAVVKAKAVSRAKKQKPLRIAMAKSMAFPDIPSGHPIRQKEDEPGTSKGTLLRDNAKRKAVKTKNNCGCCGEAYGKQPGMEWMFCDRCNNWVCEDCTEVYFCVDCC
jgi:hypothetical protein